MDGSTRGSPVRGDTSLSREGREVERNISFGRHHHWQEEAADASVPVAERMDRFEMRMGDRHAGDGTLRHCLHAVTAHIGYGLLKAGADLVGRCWVVGRRRYMSAPPIQFT